MMSWTTFFMIGCPLDVRCRSIAVLRRRSRSFSLRSLPATSARRFDSSTSRRRLSAFASGFWNRFGFAAFFFSFLDLVAAASSSSS